MGIWLTRFVIQSHAVLMENEMPFLIVELNAIVSDIVTTVTDIGTRKQLVMCSIGELLVAYS